MKKSKIIFIGFPILFLTFLCLHFYNKWYYDELYKKPKLYVYETFLGPANPVLIISDLKFKDELCTYYKYARDNKNYTSFSFPLNGLPQNDPVYLLGFSEDSLVAEVVSLYYRGKSFGGGFTQGYVSTLTLHNSPPPDSLMPGKYNRIQK